MTDVVRTLDDDTDCADLLEDISDDLSDLGTALLEGESDMDLTDDFADVEDKIQLARKYLVEKGYVHND